MFNWLIVPYFKLHQNCIHGSLVLRFYVVKKMFNGVERLSCHYKRDWEILLRFDLRLIILMNVPICFKQFWL